MIVSISRRTDIPAFYFDWLCQRLREGYVDVVNTFNRKQVSRISLKPEAVEYTQGLNLHELSEAEMDALAAGLSQIAKGSGVTLQTCSEERAKI